METGYQTGSRGPRSPPTGNETDEDDIIDIGQEGQSDAEEAQDNPHHTDTQNHQDTPERSRSPAYVAPIPKIGSIKSVSPGIQINTPDRPELPAFVGSLLIGKLVDEDGDIVDEETGQVLAHAAGDLPSMMGRRVSNAQGDILGDDGELLGYVADIEWPRARPPPTSAPRSLADLMGRATSSLMVDHAGNILDGSGNVVGKFHDNNNPLHRKEKEEKEARERAQSRGLEEGSEKPGDGQQQQQQQPPRPTPLTPSSPHGQEEKEKDQEKPQPQSAPSEESQRKPRRTEEEREKNAEDWRKENPNESPSDIFLDVKSTREGIQLTIRIPTVFNGQQTTPHISFS
jgi:hypothetical protein